MKNIELIGEIGTNHNGNIDEAIQLIDLASKAKIDTVKFQIYESKDIVSPLVKTSMYGIKSKYKFWKDYIDNKLITPIDWLKELIPYCASKGLDVITTAHSIRSAEQCLKFGVKRLKVASMDCNYLPFIDDLSRLDVPILLSTGMANKHEIMKSVDILLNNNIDITLFHCTATYPTKYEEANLDFLNFLKSLKPSKLGLSDHSKNNDLVLMSIPYGVSVIEKHITSDKDQTGPDHSFALDLDGMLDWRSKTDNGSLALGSSNKDLSVNEMANRIKYRRKPILKKQVKKGDILIHDDIYFARPEIISLDVLDIDNIENYIGMKFNKDVAPDHVLKREFFI
jgi:sialic acid synthase SpsE